MKCNKYFFFFEKMYILYCNFITVVPPVYKIPGSVAKHIRFNLYVLDLILYYGMVGDHMHGNHIYCGEMSNLDLCESHVRIGSVTNSRIALLSEPSDLVHWL
jgi:hypothetical protein